MPSTEPAALSDRVRAFLAEPHFASLSTVGPDGGPSQAVIWYRLEPDGRVLINSRDGRRWPANLQRDPRANLAVFWKDDPNRWVGLAATVDEIVDDVDRAREDIVALAERYGDAAAATIDRFRREPRVSFLLRVNRVHDHLEDD